MEVKVKTNQSRLAKIIHDRIEELKGVKTQKEIATEAGYKNANILSMIKNGESKLAIDRAIDLARALDLPPSVLLVAAFEQFHDRATVKRMMAVLSDAVTENELELIGAYREATNLTNKKLSAEQLEEIKRLIA